MYYSSNPKDRVSMSMKRNDRRILTKRIVYGREQRMRDAVDRREQIVTNQWKNEKQNSDKRCRPSYDTKRRQMYRVEIDEACVFSDEERRKVRSVLEKHQEMFEEKEQSLKGFEFDIDTGDSPPISVTPYRISPAKRKAMEVEMKKMIDLGIIRDSKSPWSAPLIMVTKKEGGWRPCVDFRRLNAVTKVGIFPLPRIDDLLILRDKYKYISTLDLRHGYWQLKMSEESRPKVAFSTPFGHFEFNRMPFGVRNGAAVFQRTMNYILGDFIDKFCLVYQDDVLILSKTIEDLCTHLEAILSRLEEFGGSLKAEKCKILRREVPFLGYIVSEEGLKVNPEKVRAIVDMPSPSSQKEVKAFLGMAGWYRRHIKNFAQESKPLTDLLKKNSKW